MTTNTITLTTATAVVTAVASVATIAGTSTSTTVATTLTPAEAARFLTQATFGPTDASINALAAGGYVSWFTSQASAASTKHLDWVMRRDAEIKLADPTHTAAAKPQQFQESFWARAISGPDQLRQRMAYALAQIFVVSFQASNISVRQAAAYYDLLTRMAFGNYVDLLKAISLSPAMAKYLNTVANKEADKDPARHPDENYAREIMQLMSIGLVMLNPDGSVKKDANGAPIPTYSQDDIAGLAKVFTGWGWASTNPTIKTFYTPADVDADISPVVSYPAFHSKASKTFLGTTLPAYTGSGAGLDITNYQNAELDSAIKAIANHPNVGPFIGRRLIQQFVTSNPSPGYIRRVAEIFANDGSGVRGNLLATLKAVLLDDEARGKTSVATAPTRAVTDADYGKLREPVLRLTAWQRAFEAKSASGNYLQPNDSGASDILNQSPLNSPTVFNFWTPDYAAPGSRVAAKNLVAPEFQILDAVSSASYINYMMNVVMQISKYGHGDIDTTYSKELALATSTTPYIPAKALVDRLNLLLCGGTMGDVLKARLTKVIEDTVPRSVTTVTSAVIADVNISRIRNAVAITVVSSDFLIQR